MQFPQNTQRNSNRSLVGYRSSSQQPVSLPIWKKIATWLKTLSQADSLKARLPRGRGPTQAQAGDANTHGLHMFFERISTCSQLKPETPNLHCGKRPEALCGSDSSAAAGCGSPPSCARVSALISAGFPWRWTSGFFIERNEINCRQREPAVCAALSCSQRIGLDRGSGCRETASRCSPAPVEFLRLLSPAAIIDCLAGREKTAKPRRPRWPLLLRLWLALRCALKSSRQSPAFA